MAVNTTQRYGFETNGLFSSNNIPTHHQNQGWLSPNDGFDWSQTISPNLLTQPWLEESEAPIGFGDLSYTTSTGALVREAVFREASIPVEQLKNELLWPQQPIFAGSSKQPQADLPV